MPTVVLGWGPNWGANLLRGRKFSRQIIISAHNASIPEYGDAGLIVSLGAESRLGQSPDSGTIGRTDIQNQVSVIMEGSTEAFRLRRERYGY